MNKRNRVKREYILTTGIIVVLGILAWGAFSEAGYVVSGARIVPGAEITITGARAESQVFIDNKRRGTVDVNGSATFKAVKPGTRNIIVAESNSWPWAVNIDVTSKERITLQPLQILQETQGTPLVDTEDPVRQRADETFAGYREPSHPQPLEHDGVRVWVEGSSVLSQKNEMVHTVFSAQNPIRNVLWYGDRNDVIVVATQNNVFAIDLSQSELKNFQPIYTGAAPEAVADPVQSDHIFVRDAENVFSISI